MRGHFACSTLLPRVSRSTLHFLAFPELPPHNEMILPPLVVLGESAVENTTSSPQATHGWRPRGARWNHGRAELPGNILTVHAMAILEYRSLGSDESFCAHKSQFFTRSNATNDFGIASAPAQSARIGGARAKHLRAETCVFTVW
jgi:hypothetical protein